MKALEEVGFARICRYAWVATLLAIFRRLPLPPTRRLFLRLCGAEIGRDGVLQPFSMFNVDRGGFRSLHIGDRVFIGDQVLIDLASTVVLEEDVTLAARAMVLTHLNVGYRDHPLQQRFPSQTAGTTIKRGSFVGAGAIVLAGCSIGPEAFVAAGSLVNREVGPGEVVGGVPIRPIRAGV